MQVIVKFIITTVDGNQEEQEFPCPPDKTVESIMTAMVQYAQVGVLKQRDNKFILIPASQIRLVEANIPLVVGANSMDTATTAQAADAIKRILK